MGFSFGDFEQICQTAALIVCPMMGDTGIQPTCYARNVEINGTIIFQPAVLFIHVVALIMVLIMVLHIRSKYTAVGRKEIVLFFYLYAAVTLLSFFLDGGIIPTSSKAYPWFAAIETGLMSATFWCLLINGFVGFQFAEDGTPLSLWSLRGSCLFVFALITFLAIATFKSLAGLGPDKPLVLWIIMFIFNGACVVIYVILQFILVLRTLDDRWPLGDITFGVAFFTIGTVILYAFSVTICDAITHYVDGLFFSTLCFLLSVMMVYKYWDSITKEDLEFSVGSKQAVWDLSTKEGLLANDPMDDYYNAPPPPGGAFRGAQGQPGGYPPQAGKFAY